MDNVEIEVKVNGKKVDLSTISTETFEKIKETQNKPVPRIRIAEIDDHNSGFRLILAMPELKDKLINGDIISLNAEGQVCFSWYKISDKWAVKAHYKNVKIILE